ncbi:TPA: hypothetical protein DIV49_00645 [Candidatus Saccharibacteria bacterium]|nr:hypothetical protein [Candidatus Saccharibacteria bacterium]
MEIPRSVCLREEVNQMADKYDAVILKAQTNPTGLSANERHDLETVCREHSSRGALARKARDGKK